MNSNLNNKLILLADDERPIVEMLFDMLELTGYRCLTAFDGREALDLFKKHEAEIDLVILDIFMPYLSGIEVYKEIEKINSNMKFLFISGYTDKHEIKSFFNNQQLPFLNKPFHFEQLLSEIKLLFT